MKQMLQRLDVYLLNGSSKLVSERRVYKILNDPRTMSDKAGGSVALARLHASFLWERNLGFNPFGWPFCRLQDFVRD